MTTADWTWLLGEAGRLRLRLMEERDRSFYCALYSDHLVMRLVGPPLSDAAARMSFDSALRACERKLVLPRPKPLGEGPVLDRGEASDVPWHSRTAPYHGLRVVAELAETDEIVALCGVDRWDENGADWELGALVPAPLQQRGYALESLRALADRLLFRGAHRILMRCSPENEAGRGVAQRLGFLGKEVAIAGTRFMLWVRGARECYGSAHPERGVNFSFDHGESR